MTLITILLMAMITFLTRYLFIHPKIPLRLNAKMVSFLSFSAPAVLTAIWVPIIFIRDGELALSAYNPYLLAGTVAVILAAKKANIYWILIASGSLFVLLKMTLLA